MKLRVTNEDAHKLASACDLMALLSETTARRLAELGEGLEAMKAEQEVRRYWIGLAESIRRQSGARK